MTFIERKRKLADRILAVDNNSIVSFLDNELTTLLAKKDILDDLPQELIEELKQQVREPWNKDTLSENDYKKLTDKWRLK